MSHVMVRMKPALGTDTDIRERARSCFATFRDVSQQSDGQLIGSWSTFNGSEIVAMFRASASASEDSLRRYLNEMCPGFDVEVSELKSMHELFDSGEYSGAGEGYRDPVDVGSDLSFPASDTPAWPKQR